MALSSIGPGASNSVPALTKLLKSPNAMVRGHAANALEEIHDGSKPVLVALADLLDDKDANVRRAAIDALVAIHPGPDVLVPILVRAMKNADMDPSVIVPALEVLAQLGDAGMPALMEALQHPKTRYWACIALGSMGPKAKAAVPDLTKLVNEKEPALRMQAVIALGDIGPDAKPAVPTLIKALSDDQYSVRYGAAYALGRIGDKAATSELTKQIDSADPFLKTIAVWAVAKLNPDDKAAMQRAVTVLSESLKSNDKRLRAAAARGLHELNAPHEMVAEALSGMMADKDPVVRANVADALSSIGEAAVPKLIKALQNDDLQSLAVAVIQRLGPKAKDAVPALIDELKDPSPEYRHEVEFALGAIGPDAKAAVPALIKEMQDEDPRVRRTACYALGKIGPAASEAIPTLQKNLTSDDKLLKLASIWALLRIEVGDQPIQKMAIEPLTKALEESDRDLVKIEAARALGDIGPMAKEAVPALEKQVKESESPEVRTAASEALKKIKQP
jgi:HEAT repeat protein